MKQQSKSSHITIGLDLGDRRDRFWGVDERGEVVEEGSIWNERDSLRKLAGRYHGALGVMEAGAHSPWISRFLEALGWRVVVSNPRKVRAIYQHERKSDQRDALMLARIGRMDLALLYPVRHGTAEAQQDLLRIKLRDSLVRARVAVVNSFGLHPQRPSYPSAQPSNGRLPPQ